MLAIIDTNVLISGTRPGNTPPPKIMRRWFGQEFILAMSDATYFELLDVLGREFWVIALKDYTDDVVGLIEQIGKIAFFEDEIPEIPVFIPDPKDTKFIALALAVDADYIVSGDKKLRAHGPYGRTPVVTPREFLDILEARDENTASNSGN